MRDIVSEDIMNVGMTFRMHTLTKVEVFDGDTVKCHDDKNNEYLVRMAYIDAPETEQEYGKEAKEALKKILSDIKVSELWVVVEDGEDRKDNHDRYLGYLVGETDNSANFLMLAGGHAWFYDDSSRKQDPLRPEPEVTEIAKKNKLGLFANEDALEPKEWRRFTHLRFNDEVNAEKIQKILRGMNPGWSIEVTATKGEKKPSGQDGIIEESNSKQSRKVYKKKGLVKSNECL